MPPDEPTARALRTAVERLRECPDPVLRDLADDLLSGRLSLRDVSTSATVRPVLEDGLQRYAQWRASISDEEYARLVAEAERRLMAGGDGGV
jgi:hypothetical protein